MMNSNNRIFGSALLAVVVSYPYHTLLEILYNHFKKIVIYIKQLCKFSYNSILISSQRNKIVSLFI